MSVDELRAQISQRLRASSAFSKTVYKEQPIIMTGSQLKSFVPDPIREARQLARNGQARGMGVADVFYEQARLLAGYEDDFEYAGTFSQYFPTYEDMSNEQLRGYFAWRTQVRAGNVQQGSLSFAYVYLYELINLIGVASAREGYDAMLAFGTAYRGFDARFGALFDAWLDDFVIYYGLDANLLKSSSHADNDAAFDVLLRRGAHGASELFGALCQLGSYAIKDSPFYVEHADELEHLVAFAYRTAAEHHDEKLATTLAAKLSGRLGKQRIAMFERAVFADPLDVQSATYAISPHDSVFCRAGAWFRVRYAALESPLPWVTQLLETCECILRDEYAFPNTLEQPLKTKYLVKAISKQAHEMVARRKEREARAVHIDFGKLDSIRSAADETCEKLIVEEEQAAPVFERTTSHVILGERSESRDPAATNGDPSTSGLRPSAQNDMKGAASAPCAQSDEEADSAGETPEPRSKGASRKDREASCRGATIETEAPRSRPLPLSPQEHELLAHLLQGGSAHDFERAHACIVSVLVDSINEKLYDEFADICIDVASGDPVVLEDYTEDLRALLDMN